MQPIQLFLRYALSNNIYKKNATLDVCVCAWLVVYCLS